MDWRVGALRRLFATTLPYVATGNAAGDIVIVCYFESINAHTGVECDYGNDQQAFANIKDDADLIALVSKALPGSFRASQCPAPIAVSPEQHRYIACFRDPHTTLYISQLVRWRGYTFVLDFLDDRAPATNPPPDLKKSQPPVVHNL